MAWHDILIAGIDSWSEYSDTDSDREIDVVDGDGSSFRATRAEERDALRRVKSTDVVHEGARVSGSGRESLSGGPDSAHGGEWSIGGESDGNGTRARVEREGEPRASGSAEARVSQSAANERNGKIALDGTWRSTRRGLEWQCAWIELRMREIARHEERYKRRLEALDARSDGARADAMDVNANANGDEKSRSRADTVRTKRERGAGAAAPPAVVLGHPMFAPLVQLDDKDKSANENKVNSGGPDPSVTTTHAMNANRTSDSKKRELESSNPKSVSAKKQKIMDSIAPKETNSDSDLSTTALYEQIEAATKRLASLKERISKPALKLTLAQPSKDKFKTPAQKGKSEKHLDKTPVSAGSGRKSGARNVDSYDINNVVSAHIAAKYVERPIHETIATPRVRSASTFAMTFSQIVTDGNSSDEDISDEVFIFRHAKLEVAEKKARTPLQKARRGEKVPNKPSGKGSLFALMNGDNPFAVDTLMTSTMDVDTHSIEA